MNRVVCLMAVVVAAALSAASASRPCSTHCPDPYINAPGHYVCCDQHPGTCVPRRECPALYGNNPSFIPTCHYDPECAAHEKCCYDPCISEQVCQFPDPN